jgi:hypothetical protein
MVIPKTLQHTILNLIQNLVFVVFDFDKERITDPRSGMKNMFSSANGEPFNGEPVPSLFPTP